MATKPESQARRAAVGSDGPGSVFELVTRALDVAYYEWLPECDELSVSPALLELLGCEPGTWTRQRCGEAIHPDDQPGYHAARVAYFKSDTERAEFVYRARAASGEYRWQRDQTVVERDASGRVVRLVGVVADITEAKQREARQRSLIASQTASIEVLRAISASPNDTQPVFELIARHARDLCGATSVALTEYDGALMHLRVFEGAGAIESETLRRAYPRPPAPDFITGRVVLSGELWHVRDLTIEAGLLEFTRVMGFHSALGVPLRRDGRSIGALVLARPAIGGFDDDAIALVQWFAEQAVIAIAGATTLAELRTRNSEYRERIDQQAATIDVLKAMSASPGNAQPVFDLIAKRAAEVCSAPNAVLFRYEGGLLHWRASSGTEVYASPDALEALKARFPMAPMRQSNIGRAVLERRIIHVRDLDAEPEIYQALRDIKMKSFLSVPLLRDGAALGAIGISAKEPGGFSDSQIELLKAFAEQAVIAIGSAETFQELEAQTATLARRNSEYGERIEQQSATIDVLKVMSSSPGDAQPVFELIARRALDFCGATGARLTEFDGTLQHLRALVRADRLETEADAAIRRLYPAPPDAESISGRVILHGDIVHARDPNEVPPGMRGRYQGSVVGVPLLREGRVAGAIVLSRGEPGGFSDTQVELLQTFAEQATIAITSAETYRELRERTAALARRNSEYGEQIEHQSATIDVLKAMSASPDATQEVFDLITRRARELCNGPLVGLFEFDGELVHLRSSSGTIEHAGLNAMYPMRPTRETISGRAIVDKRTVHIRDVDADPHLSQAIHESGSKSILSVPLMRDDTAVGAISLNGTEPGGFSDGQVALLQTFAEQAVIAIGSAATYRELQERTSALAQRNAEYGERIEHQSATIDVLKAMSGTPDDTQPVFDLIARRAAKLCESRAGLWELRDGQMQVVAGHGLEPEIMAAFRSHFPRPPDRSTASGRAILDRRIIHVREVAADPTLGQAARDLGGSAVVAIPLLRDEQPIGVIALNGNHPGGFSDSQIALLRTFAEQAVIAIGSVATYRALRERTAELTRSVGELQALEEVLRAVNSSLDLETVLATIISRAVRLSLSDEGTIYEFDEIEQVFVPKTAFGMSDERVALLRDRRIRLGETHLGRSAVLRAPVAIDDVQRDPSVPATAAALPGIHAVLAVPLLRDDAVIGGLVIRRRSEDSFAPNLVTLLQTFAGQAVLAIENARLFQEARQARTAAEAALLDLRRAQDRLVQSEKMASLGQLTAGIAHEIKNPLNFVNNFADLSVDLLDELHEAVSPEKLAVAAGLRAEIDELTATLKVNLEKIAQHGRRADSIVKNMLLHSRSGPSEQRLIDLNSTVEEALNLAYHGARAETPGFNITMVKQLDPRVGMVELFPQEFIRVMLNLVSNGFYAAHKRAATAGNGFEPTLRLTTRDLGDQVEIRVCDNGTGIDAAVRDKIFEPFFTTKPAGEGTGLGLSLSYDIVVKQHGGQLTVDSQNDTFTEFLITLPRRMATNEGGRA
jgi:GAF domain-containing protein